MNQRNNTNSTPALDALQIKIELLRKGSSIREWSRRNGFTHTTVIRAIYGHPSSGPCIERARAMLQDLLINSVNNTNTKRS